VVFLLLAGLPQPTARAVTDTTPPTGKIIINGNRTSTNSRTVTIAMTWSDGTDGSGVARMHFSDDGMTWSAYESLTPSRSYTLPVGADGYRTIRIQFIDKANNRSAVFSDYILLDRTVPTGTIDINNGASSTVIQAVTLGLAYADGSGSGVSRMRFSDNGSTWTDWVTPKVARTHTLPAAVGYHTVRVQYLDGAGNYSVVYSDYIKFTPRSVTTETVTLPGDVPLEMVWVPGGTFTMGSADTEQDRQSNEGPQHSVTLGGFWMAKYELTKRQWTAVMGTTPWAGLQNVNDYVETTAVCISWPATQAFLTALNTYTGKTFRLPSEAQWEYACRGGTATRFYWGDDPTYTAIGDYAWYFTNAYLVGQDHATVGGQRLPNVFGLYDMGGNAAEWCQDGWHDSYAGAPTDGSVWTLPGENSYHVLRGGGCDSYRQYCRSATRDGIHPANASFDLGFRLAR